ncbi:SAM-dependent methyltransferase [Mesorhizobium sp.]|uniref:SAM-dependent methyltransferase n=1 Tax=Mesorhizobium sp. TaxID=1871066 RepID=UPI0025BB8E03|nr:SAM-dependent methyltransferase [Mesorhizobium sp.]
MNDVVAFDASGLAETVERARALLDDGDVAAARMLAAGVYDQAKAGAAFAARFGAAERLVAKARRLQGDALLIEARAKVRLADEYDEAKKSGAAAAQGRPKNIPDENVFKLEDAGLSAKEVHEARRLRDAELRTPGIVERAIAARLAAGLEPSRANLRAAVGTDTATAAERGNNLYETPPEAMRTLLNFMRFSPKVLEPACGKGAISRMLEDAGYEVELADLVDYGTATKDGEVQRVEDFCASASTAEDPGRPDICTNPPYGAALNAFVAHALRAHRPRRMALLLNLNFMCGFDDEDRNYAMDEAPPSRILVFKRRLPMMHRDGWTGPEASSRMNTAWFIWELRPQADGSEAYDGPTDMLRVDWKVFENAALCGPVDADASSSPTSQEETAPDLLAAARAFRAKAVSSFADASEDEPA